MNFLLQIGTAIITSIIAFVGAYNYLPLGGDDMFGASITTIQGTDTLRDSRAVINTNFSNLNTALTNLEATTTMSLLTSAPSLATVGTITSGVWNGTAIPVAYGGTGTTSPTSNQVILGNGASGFKVVVGLGNSGEFLTSNGAGSPPTWQASSVDQTANYNFTGNFLVKNLFASSTVANPLYLNGIDYAFPSSEGATSTVLATDGVGNLSWNTIRNLMPRDSFIAATTTSTTVANTATETTYDSTGTITLPANTIGTKGTVRILLTISDLDYVADVTTNNRINIKFKLGGTTICDLDTTSSIGAAVDLAGHAECIIYANNSTSSQFYQGILNTGDRSVGNGAGNSRRAVTAGTSSVNTATALQVTATIQWSGANSGNTITATSLSVTAY